MKERSVPSDETRKMAPVHLVWDGEMMIESSIRHVWRHVMNYPSWQNFPIVKHISGRAGQEGEVVLLRKEEKGFEFPPYYAVTIKIDPERRVIWKTYPEKGTLPVEFFGIVEFTVEDLGGRTRFRYHSLYEFLVPHQNESELETFRKQQDVNFRTLFSTVFPKLKHLAEGKG